MQYYKCFNVKDLLSPCTDNEILTCIKNNNLDNLLLLGGVLDELKEFLQNPIVILSSYRSFIRNKNFGGSPVSQHLYGAAIDFSVKNMPFQSVVACIKNFFEISCCRQYIGLVCFYYDKECVHFGLKSSNYPVLFYKDYGKTN